MHTDNCLFFLTTQAMHQKRMKSPARNVPAASAPRARREEKVWKGVITRKCPRKRTRRRT